MSNQSILHEVSDYKVGELDRYGSKVIMNISRSNECAVYLVEGEELRYEFINLSWNMTNVMMHFDDLRSKISSEIPENIRVNVLISLGIALFHSSRTDNEQDAFKAFNNIEKRIKNLRTPNEAKATLVALNLAFCIVFSVILFTFTKFDTGFDKALLACCSAGCFGALFSLLQRNTSIPLNLVGGNLYTVLQSLFICVLGLISGSAIFMLANSGLALSVAKDNITMLALFSMISGFSERMIPDLFNKIQKSSDIET